MINNPLLPDDFNEELSFGISFEPSSGSGTLLVDITLFLSIIKSCFDTVDKKTKRLQIQKLMGAKDWVEHHRDKITGRRVLAESHLIEHKHELHTAILLTKANYDVVFAPKGMFNRNEKKFDVFLLRDFIILKADLKSISSSNPDTIGNRIKEGSEQASRVVIDIKSSIVVRNLIDGLKLGAQKNKNLKEVLLFYNGKFYRLEKPVILGNKIFDVFK